MTVFGRDGWAIDRFELMVKLWDGVDSFQK